MQPRPKKNLGQHFLTDVTYCDRIVRFAGVTSSDLVVEIGPGTGRLTRSLLSAADRVVAIEFDGDMIDYLNVHLVPEAGSRLTLLQADVLQIDWASVLETPTVKIVGNLPYNISTRLLTNMTGVAHRFQSLTCMLQSEVSDRILAAPGSKDYGFFTLLMQYHFERREGFRVPPGAFRPPPQVMSAVLQLVPQPPPAAVPDYDRFVRLLQVSFRHRRKTLWNNLKTHHEVPVLQRAFQSCGIDERSRAEEISLQHYACLGALL